MASKNRRPQTPKQRVGGTSYRSQVALDALGVTDGNRRSTRQESGPRRMGTKRAVLAAAMAE